VGGLGLKLFSIPARPRPAGGLGVRGARHTSGQRGGVVGWVGVEGAKRCTTGQWYNQQMTKLTAIDEINRLLDDAGKETTNTSMRLPVALRDAAGIAVAELGAAPSTTALASAALRTTLEAIVMQAALDAHYAEHPEARPSLADLALAAAELDDNPLAQTPELLHQAAEQVGRRHPDANADDVLLWAEALASVA